jgi:hypothetical protein
LRRGEAMTKEAITERLKFLTELLRLVWISLLAIGGGTVGLIERLSGS